MVERVLLDAVEELQGIVKCLAVARGTDIFRQAVDGKADGVELLARVQGLPFAVEAPVDAAKLLVDEVADEVVLGASGSR